MKSKQNSTGQDGEPIATIEDMHDGERLRAVLERHGKKPADLERTVGKSRQMVNVYMNKSRFTAHMRATIRGGLDKLGIDPAELSDDPTAITDPATLRRLLDRIPFEALPDVKRMLEIQDRSTRTGLIALIEDRIERRR